MLQEPQVPNRSLEADEISSSRTNNEDCALLNGGDLVTGSTHLIFRIIKYSRTSHTYPPVEWLYVEVSDLGLIRVRVVG